MTPKNITQKPDPANVIALLKSAHKAALAEADNETLLFTEAFDAAEECGWDWESDTNFTNWCLKATSPEIAEEGLRLFRTHIMTAQPNEMQSPEAKSLLSQISRIDSNSGAICRDGSVTTIQELRETLAYLLQFN